MEKLPFMQEINAWQHANAIQVVNSFDYARGKEPPCRPTISLSENFPGEKSLFCFLRKNRHL
jgi:hypothetical protein